MLIGREELIARLTTLIAADGPLVVVGEAGVGKTTLVREAARRARVRLLEGGGLATLAWLPYLPLQRALGAPVPVGDEVYVAQQIRQAARGGALFLDDLHWADSHTRNLIRLLQGRMPLIAAVRRGDPAAPEVLRQAEELGFQRVDVDPLSSSDGHRLVAQLRPEMPHTTARRIVEQAGGNPLLIEELTRHGGPTESLRLAMAARLRTLTEQGRRSMGLLSLAGRPLPLEALGNGARELVWVGLAETSGATASVRHALLAETMLTSLDPGELRHLHSALARTIDTPGEAARHHAAAGEAEAARDKALLAAERSTYPGERARHLALAASCAAGSDADQLRLEAARAMVEAHDHSGVEQLLDAIESTDPLIQAEVNLLRYQLEEVAKNFPAARAAWARARELARGSGSDIEIRLIVEAGRMAYLLDYDPRAVEIAQQGLDLARSRGRHEVLAQFVLASALWTAWDERWPAELTAAVERARGAGEIGVEYRATNNLVLGLVLDGRLDEARRWAEEGRAMADSRHLGRWQQRMTALLVKIDWHQGHLKRAVELGEALLDDVAESLDRRDATIYVARALIDLGRYPVARRLLEGLLGELGEGGRGLREGSLEDRVDALVMLADAEFWAGRPRPALSLLATARDYDASPHAIDTVYMIPVIEAWARLDLQQDVTVTRPDVLFRLWQAVPVELDAVGHLAAGQADEASARFAGAAELWRERMVGSHLRCRWAQGASLRRADRRREAIAVLEDAEQLATELGYNGILTRIQRSLRLAGVRRAAPRAHQGLLTAREHEVLGLVSRGYSNPEIARQLGVSTSTVKRILESAARKLGATSRLQAAALGQDTVG